MSEQTAPPTAAARILRALALHCPECGGGQLFTRWLYLKQRCPTCGLKTDRANPDHFVGAYLVNLIVAELLFAVVFVAWMLIAWPDVPWHRIEVVLATAVIIAPLLLYPFTRTLWLAVDLIFDPLRASDR